MKEKIKMVESISPNQYRFWFQQAEIYYSSANIISKENSGLLFPIMTLQAFSIECALKGLFLLNNSEYKLKYTHNLYDLFKCLPSSIKEDLNYLFPEIEKYIQLIKNDFMTSRYFFENFKNESTHTFYDGILTSISDFFIQYIKENLLFIGFKSGI
ncbi:HEPN domain-containing protein (plasmid) [Acinetobacter sp. ESL0695]|uniref:HEPN domain-containing protein n=1 Tax=Acinetobacter sp. ESL0695 TaxID=2983215 RepID=UPI0023F303BD|nr:HEPN domain-containing protein [Acinetobacter sp. ESL0695]WEV50220.1 HEPN domain-containing protein [Acinetobacter sp. ESL0695]